MQAVEVAVGVGRAGRYTDRDSDLEGKRRQRDRLLHLMHDLARQALRRIGVLAVAQGDAELVAAQPRDRGAFGDSYVS